MFSAPHAHWHGSIASLLLSLLFLPGLGSCLQARCHSTGQVHSRQYCDNPNVQAARSVGPKTTLLHALSKHATRGNDYRLPAHCIRAALLLEWGTPPAPQTTPPAPQTTPRGANVDGSTKHTESLLPSGKLRPAASSPMPHPVDPPLEQPRAEVGCAMVNPG